MNYLPKRGPATNLVDSLAHDDGSYLYVDGTGTATIVLETDDGQIIFGTGGTNVIQRTVGNPTYLTLTNGAVADGVGWRIINGNGNVSEFATDTGGNALVAAGSGKSVVLGPDNSGEVYFGSSLGFYPNSTNLLLGLRLATTRWGDLHEAGKHHLYAELYGGSLTNYSELVTFAESGIGVFDFENGGLGTPLSKFSFRSNGVEVASLPTGAGAGPWTESPTGTASLVAGVTNIGIVDQISGNTNILASIGDVPLWNGGIWPVDRSIIVSATSDVGIEGITIVNGLAYTIGDGTPGPPLSIYDLRNPLAPTKLSTFSTFRAYTLVVDGGYAYICNHNSGLFNVVDVSNPQSPSLTGTVTDTSLSGSEGIAKLGNVVYVATLQNSLMCVDVSVPGAPSVIGGITNNTSLNQPYQIVANGTNVYVACVGGLEPEGRFTIVNVSTPSTPTITSSIYLPEGPDAVGISGNYAYVGSYGWAGTSGPLTVVDVSDPASPVTTGSVFDSRFNGLTSLTVSSNLVFSTGTGSDPGNMTITDVSDPTNPVVTANVIDTRLNGNSQCAIADGYAWNAAGFFADAFAANSLVGININNVLISYIGSKAPSYNPRFSGSVSVTGTVSANAVVATNTVSAGYANAWKLGAVKTCSAVTVVLTNYIEIVIDGTTNAIPILNVTP